MHEWVHACVLRELNMDSSDAAVNQYSPELFKLSSINLELMHDALRGISYIKVT